MNKTPYRCKLTELNGFKKKQRNFKSIHRLTPMPDCKTLMILPRIQDITMDSIWHFKH